MGTKFIAVGIGIFTSLSGYKALDVAEANQAATNRENQVYAQCIEQGGRKLLQVFDRVSVSGLRTSDADYSASANFTTPDKIHVNLEAYSTPGYNNAIGQAVNFSLFGKQIGSRSMVFLRNALPQDPAQESGETLVLPIDSYEAVENPAKVNVLEFSNLVAKCADPDGP